MNKINTLDSKKRDPWNYNSISNICFRVPSQEKKDRAQRVLEEIMTKISQNFAKDINYTFKKRDKSQKNKSKENHVKAYCSQILKTKGKRKNFKE